MKNKKKKNKMLGKNPYGGNGHDEEIEQTIELDEEDSGSERPKTMIPKRRKKKKHKAGNPYEPGKKRKRKKKKKKSCWWAAPLCAVCVLVLGFISLYCVNTVFEYQDFEARKASIMTDTFYSGVVVENINLSGETVEAALNYWEKTIETPLRETSIVFDLSDVIPAQCISCEELGYSSDYRAVIMEAWSGGRNGTFEERYRSINTIGRNTSRYDVTRVLFDEDMLRGYTDGLADALTLEPVNAQIEDFDFQTRTFTFTKASPGYRVDKDKLFEQAKALMLSGGGRLAVEIETVQPAILNEDVEGSFGMITQAVTNASSSSNNRLTNVKLACSAVDGTVIMPGETFSYNDTVGKRTAANGYKVATVYQAGEVAEDIGGGICQVSTTVWNAAMKADCSIVERHEHSRPVSYVDRGKDATVSWGSQDMKFKNTSDYPMYMVCYVSDSKRVYCEIYGRLFDDGKYITIDATTTKTIKPGDPVKTLNPALARGETVVVSEARTGYKASAYRVYHNADGSVIEKVLLCTSYYKEAAAKIEYGE